ncbi:MAG: Tol-Pal system beta propeller repeat protein TolB [Pseudomonadota bacterium]
MRFLTLSLFVVIAFISPAKAQLEIDITTGKLEALPIAISPFHAEQSSFSNFARDIPQIISANLESSGLFKALNRNSFIQTPDSIFNDSPRFGEWRAINAQALVSGNVTKTNDGRTRVEFRLWDVFTQQQLIGMAYMTTPQNWRRIAHIISDEIYKRITGEDGYFDTRIVYIAEQGPPNKRSKRLAIMDQDGFNHKFLTPSGELVLTPRFSPTAQEITYMSYRGGKPRVYLYNIDTGRQELLGNFPGMTFAPRFSPDGNKVIMSLSKNGNSDIHILDLRTRKSKQVTNHSGIDTAPSYAPDGSRIVFESDRGGSQQLYTMNKNGGDVKRITFGKGRYANPVWSPRGDLIAFTKMLSGQFYIGVIRPDGSGERLITKAYHVEGPSWSPNGRVLTYFKERPINNGRGRSAKLYTIDLTGYNEQILKTPRDGSDPAWSPVNP